MGNSRRRVCGVRPTLADVKKPIGRPLRHARLRAQPALRGAARVGPRGSPARLPASPQAWLRAWLAPLVLFGAALPAHADAPSFVLPAAARDQALELVQQAAAAIAPAGARIVAKAGALDSRLKLAACARIEPFLVAGLPAWGHTRVGLRCAQGATPWRAFLPVQVQVLAPAWTSLAALPAGARVSAEQWELAETDWAATPAAPLGPAAAIAGRTLARPTAAGQTLREGDLLARRWFSSGQTVRIVATGSGYRVSAEGQALGHGIEGQPVRVRTEGGRIISGQAVGEALVEVQL
jgi:flagella basal body P-ring formation protein FlgA